jgi:hypothetical protein
MLARSGYGFAGQTDGLIDHGLNGSLYGGQIRPGVDQSAQQHVARYPGGGVDPQMELATHGAAICAAR